jgi:hypothetical protein
MAGMKLRFTIRDWIWLAVAIAIGIILLLQHLEIRQLSKAVDEMRYWTIIRSK